MVQRSRVRVSILAPTFPRRPGGGARTYYEHANGLARRGYEVSVVHSLNLRPLYRDRVTDIARGKVRDLRAGNVRRRVNWMPIDPRVRMVTVDRFDDSARLPAADIRVGTFWKTSAYLGTLPADGTVNVQMVQAYETWAGPAAEVDATWLLPMHLAVVSESLRRKGIELGVPSSRLHVVPNGLDSSVFHSEEPVGRRLPQVTFLSHPSPVKGLVDSIRVAELIHQRRPDVKFVAFGSSPRPPSLPGFVGYVRGLSGRALATRVYNETAVFLCTSHSEGWGFPSMESMACGAALVSTRNGGVDDFATDGDSAVLCDVGDVEALATAVIGLIDAPASRTALAKRGIESVARFTWEASTDKLEHVLVAALDAGTAM